MRLHPRNRNRENYNLAALTTVCPELADYIIPNKAGAKSVNFANPEAVKRLNQAILKHYYGIEFWEFPDENLCPPIPGRADYLHHIADLLAEENNGVVPKGDAITCLDIGVGASCIYPIIGVVEYGWTFIASDVDPNSIATSQKIINNNPILKNKVTCVLQPDSKKMLDNILSSADKIDVTICNPPFHKSIEDAQKATRRKVKNLFGKKMKTPTLNFSGNNKELVYEGGELQFILNLISESQKFAKNCKWFSTLVSKQSNLKGIEATLKKANTKKIRTIPLGTSNKSSRIVAWIF